MKREKEQIANCIIINEERETNRFFQVAGAIEGLKTEVMPPVMPAEDFSYYLQKVPGCFIFVGAGNSDKGAVYPHHHAKFDLDEESMRHAAEVLIGLAEAYIEEYSE